MKSRRRPLFLWLAVLHLVAYLVTIHYNRDVFDRGFYTDDWWWMKNVAGMGYGDIPQFFDPRWGSVYRPAFNTYFLVFIRHFGMDPKPFEVMSIFLQATNMLLLGVLVWRLSRSRVAAIGAAILFLLAPGRQAYIWISSANVLFCLCFCLCSLHCWISYRNHDRKSLYALSLTFFLLALWSKEEALGLPFGLLAYELLYRRAAFNRALLLRAAPFALLCCTSAATSYISNLHNRLYRFEVNPSLDGPIRMAPTYWLQLGARIELPGIAGIFLGLSGVVLIGLVAWRNRASATLFCWATMAGLPVPLMIGWQARTADRYVYVASGIAAGTLGAIVCWGLASKNFVHRFTAAALIGSIVFTVWGVGAGYANDPFNQWCALFLAVGLVVVLAAARNASWGHVPLSVVLALLSQSRFVTENQYIILFCLLAAMSAAAAAAGRKEAAWAALAVSVLWNYPVAALPALILAAALSPARTAEEERCHAPSLLGQSHGM